MTDPFRPNANQQLMREARIGLTLLAITLGTFAYVAYHRISGNGEELPAHVLNAPIAEAVWPGEDPLPLVEKRQTPQTPGSQFGGLLANARKKYGVDKETSPATEPLTHSREFVDPTPRKDNSPMPSVKVPNRREPDQLAIADVQRNAATRIEDKGFADTRSRRAPKLPIDTNDLRSTTTKAKPAREPRLTSNAPKKRLPIIVTPKKPDEFDGKPIHSITATGDDRVTNADFVAKGLRPISKSSEPQLTQSNDFAPPRNGKTEFQPIRAGFDKGDKQVTVDRSISHEGSKTGGSDVTSDIAANLTGTHAPIFPQRRPEKQTSYDNEPLLQPSLAENNQLVPGSPGQLPVKLLPANPAIDDKTDGPHEHLVLAGESFWSIAQQHYEDGRFFRALYEYNKQRVGSFENLVPGNAIATPPKQELVKLWPKLCPSLDHSSPVSTNIDERVYVTQEGDTLFQIARQRLEQASRYLEIQILNKVRLPDGVNHLSPLPAGIHLVLPQDLTR